MSAERDKAVVVDSTISHLAQTSMASANMAVTLDMLSSADR